MNLSVIIVDDEPLACRRMQRLLSQIENVKVVGEGHNGTEALELVKEHMPDILFLDIEMPKMNGIETAKVLNEEVEYPPAIIFCTAYDQFALNAFDYAAVAYLLKPVELESIASAIETANRISSVQLKSLKNIHSEAVADDTISLLGEFGIDRILISKVNYFRSEQKNLIVGITDGTEHIVNYTLNQLQERFPDNMIRVHRNALLNKQYLSRLRQNEHQQYVVELNGCQTQFIVSRRHLTAVKQYFK